MRRCLAAGLMLVAPVVQADEVYTRAGGRLTGEIIERRPGSIVIDIGIGQIEMLLSSVERIVPGEVPRAVYARRAAALAADDVGGWLALARWAREQDLSAEAAEAYAHVLAQDPENAAARQALGHEKADGRWMTPEQRAAERRAAPAEAAGLDEPPPRPRPRRDAHARAREADARIREAEARARVAEAAARLAEVEAQAAEDRHRGVGSRGDALLQGPVVVGSVFPRPCRRGGCAPAEPLIHPGLVSPYAASLAPLVHGFGQPFTYGFGFDAAPRLR